MGGLRLFGAALLAVAAGYGVAWAESPDGPLQVKVIKVSAKRFEFIPREITLKKGQTVELELSTQDVVMGFNAPGFATRADIIPGQAAHVRLTPDKAGTFPFLCDIFCGTGHEDMNGVITVVD